MRVNILSGPDQVSYCSLHTLYMGFQPPSNPVEKHCCSHHGLDSSLSPIKVPNDAADHILQPNTPTFLTFNPWMVREKNAGNGQAVTEKGLLSFVILAFGAHGAWLLCDGSLSARIGMKS